MVFRSQIQCSGYEVVSPSASRMEVQADVQKERCSLSGESATVSLGTISDNASTRAMAGSILNAYMPLERSAVQISSSYVLQKHIFDVQNVGLPPSITLKINLSTDHLDFQSIYLYVCLLLKFKSFLCRDNSLEVQADVESKQEKIRHCSASSSLDEPSCSTGTAGLKAAGGASCLCSCPSTSCSANHDTHCFHASSLWSKETSNSSSSSSGGKKSKGKLWKRGSGRAETKINETRESVNAQHVEQRSTNSSEFDSPSLSGSLPSVADSHCSHFSSELSCSDPETSRPSLPSSSGLMDPRPRPAATFNDSTVTPMPEVEHDRLEHYPSQTGRAAYAHHVLSASPPASPEEGSSGTFLYISEENAGGVADKEPGVVSAEPDQDEDLKETNNSAGQPAQRSIQTDI